jgi:hypothetical protein
MTSFASSSAALSGATLALLTGCANIRPVGDPRNALSGQREPDRIDWPAQYETDRSTFTIRNEIDIHASPEAVWDMLILADAWPDWYIGASYMQIDAADGRLAPDAVFRWRTMDQNFTSTVTEFVPPYRLAWESRKPTIKAYHAWLIVKTEDGCRLITEESQYGLLAWLQKMFLPDKLYDLHEVWLQGFKARAESATQKAGRP